jgi:serine/threonine protein kinase
MAVDLSVLPEAIQAKALELSGSIEFNKSITKGANGHVLIGTNKILDRAVVVKFYYWGGGDHAEPALLAALNSDHVLKVFDAAAINEEDAYFMTPFCEGGDLDDELENSKFGPLQAIDVILQIASGLSYLHGSGYLHRDLKPSNIFCASDNKYLIGDFGSVVVQNAEGYAQTLTRHSLLYRPPEELALKRSFRQGDIYQLGMVLFQLLGGYLPYDERVWLTSKQQKLYDAKAGFEQQLYATSAIEDRISKGKVLDFSSLPPWVPKSLMTVIRRACAVDYKKRYAATADFCSILNNLRSKAPDWRIGGDVVLHRPKKQIRVVSAVKGLLIEKRINGGWRTERQLKPIDWSEAIQMAEGL